MQYRRFGCSMGAVRALAAGGRQQKWSDLYQANSNSYEISVEVTGSPWTSFLGLLIRWSAVRIRPGEPIPQIFSNTSDRLIRLVGAHSNRRHRQAGSTTAPRSGDGGRPKGDPGRGERAARIIRPLEPGKSIAYDYLL